MSYKIISQEDLASFIDKLIQEKEVMGVKKKENQFVYGPIKSYHEACLDYNSTILPPKKYFFPPKETLIKYSIGEEVKVDAEVETQPMVLFGVHPCDIHGINILDEVFSDENADVNYLSKRAAATIIGLECKGPDEYCFCKSVGTDTVKEGFDLFLTDIGGKFILEIGSEKGEKLLANHGTKVTDVTDSDLISLGKVKEEKAEKFALSINTDVSSLPLFLNSVYDSKVWEDLDKICYSCGSCNLVCPTCYCFDVLDRMNLSLTEGERIRQWDGCQLSDFALVASGENFRDDRANRNRHRIYRKYQYQMTKYGTSHCIGCGRCSRACLVDINPANVINDLLKSAQM